MRTPSEPPREAIQLTDVLHALSDPVRLQIVADLADAGELQPGAADATVSKSTLSYHFRMLRQAGVTRTRIEGKEHFVSLRYEDLEGRFPGLLTAVLAEAHRLRREALALRPGSAGREARHGREVS